MVSVQAQEIIGNGVDDDGDCNIDCNDLEFGVRTVEYTNGMNANFVVGQNDFVTNTAGIGPTSFDRPYDVAIDPTTGKVFVSDLNNHRVTRYPSIDKFIHNQSPEAVIGQSDLVSKVTGVSSSRLYEPTGIFVDDNGALWVSDWGNHRVLRFNNASNLGNLPTADLVLGQLDFSTNTVGTTSSEMNRPVDVIVVSGTLWVADQVNGRVLRFDNASSLLNGANADGVLGSPDFITLTTSVSSSEITSANGLVMICNHLYVSDGTKNRVLRWDNPSTLGNGANANAVLGQDDFVSSTSAVQANRMVMPRLLSADDKNNLYVNDASSNRILIFREAGAKSNGANADVVLGQADFTSSEVATSQNGFNSPRGISVISDGNKSFVTVAEALGNRIMIFGRDELITDELTDLSSTLAGYDPSGSGGLTYAIVSQPSSGTVILDNVNTGDYTFYPGGACPNDFDTDVSFNYQVSNNNGCSAIGYEVIKVTDVSACVEINGNGIDDDGDCNVDCEDMSFGVRINKFHNGLTSSHLAGQSSYSTSTSGLGATRYSHPYDIAMDPISKKVFVSDSHNHRILRYSSMEALIYNDPAEAVFGQVDFTSNVSGASATNLNYPVGIYVDNSGILWVADWGNRRVIRFDDAANATNGAAADGVLGQADFTSLIAKTTINGMSAVTDVVVDDNGTLYVAEESNQRVLRFDNASSKPNGANADGVLGSPDFSSKPTQINSSNTGYVLGIAIACNSLYVSDSDNHRILRWDNPSALPNGAPANRVLGQSDFVSGGPSVSQSTFDTPRLLHVDSKNNLYVTDEMNHRILIFNEVGAKNNGANADVVIGQTNFSNKTNGVGNNKFNRPKVGMLLEDGLGSYLVVVDELNNRIMGFGGGYGNTTETLNLNSTLPASDPSGTGGLSYSLISQPSYGTVTLVNSTTGQYLFTPAEPCIHDEDFTVSFVYQVSNSNACSQLGEMVIRVSDTGPCVEICNNGIDDDLNGLTDQNDPTCDNDNDGVANGQDKDLDNDGIINQYEQYTYGGLGFCLNTITKVFLYDDFGTGLRGESPYIPMCFEHGEGAGVTCSSHYDSNTFSASVDWGEYCLVKNSSLADQGGYNWDYTYDYVNGINARIAVVNGGNVDQVIYERVIEGLVIGVRIKVDLKFKNLSPAGSNLAKPKFHFEYWSENGVLLFTTSSMTSLEDGNWHGGGRGAYICTQSNVVFKMVLEAAALPGNDLAFDKINVRQVYLDCDNDGIPNIYDLDNDNDGLTNLVEQANADVDGNGVTDNVNGDGSLMNDANNNGADDAYEGQALLDTDGDHLKDMYDHDSDNDGIYDVLEAGGSDPDFDGFIGEGAVIDADGDGLSSVVDTDESGTPLVNFDSDNDGTDDAKELDSDNDGCFDVQEAGFPDNDSNGLLGIGTTGAGLIVNGLGAVINP